MTAQYNVCYNEAMTKIMVLPDIQAPYQDDAFIGRLLRVVRTWKPDEIVQVGDLIDLPEVSRWTKGLAGEYAGTLQASLDFTRDMLVKFRKAAPQARFRIKEGNHDERYEKYTRDHAPAKSDLRSESLAFQLGLAGLDIEYERKPFEVAPGVICAHGHEQAYSSIPGKYELERIRQYGTSVVTGHTHTPVLVTTTVGMGETSHHLFGMNVGHAMDESKAGYLKDGYSKWCKGFGILEVHDGVTYPRLVTAPKGRFVWQGKLY